MVLLECNEWFLFTQMFFAQTSRRSNRETHTFIDSEK